MAMAGIARARFPQPHSSGDSRVDSSGVMLIERRPHKYGFSTRSLRTYRAVDEERPEHDEAEEDGTRRSNDLATAKRR